MGVYLSATLVQIKTDLKRQLKLYLLNISTEHIQAFIKQKCASEQDLTLTEFDGNKDMLIDTLNSMLKYHMI